MSSESVRSWQYTGAIPMNSTSKSHTNVQYRIRSQSCGRKETSGGKSIKPKQINRERILLSKHVSKYELDDFFNRTNDQITRITSNQVSNFIANNFQLEKSSKLNGENLTLADIYSLAPHVANKLSPSIQKIDPEATRGFRLPSTRFGHAHYRTKRSPIRNSPIRLIDILPKNDYSGQRPSTAVSDLSKTSVRFFTQRQNTSFKTKSSKTTRAVTVQNMDNIDALEKTVMETLLICSMPMQISSSKSLNKTK